MRQISKRVGSAEAPPTNLPPFYEKVSLICLSKIPQGSISHHPGQQTILTSLRQQIFTSTIDMSSSGEESLENDSKLSVML